MNMREVNGLDLKVLGLWMPFAMIICRDHEGWLVGTGAESVLGKRSPDDVRDIDMFCPPHHYKKASSLLCASNLNVQVNMFGGLRLRQRNGRKGMDFWADTLGNYMRNLPNNSPCWAIDIARGSVVHLDRNLKIETNNIQKFDTENGNG